MAPRPWTTLVGAGDLAGALGARPGAPAPRAAPPGLVLLDVRHSLQDLGQGPKAFAQGHLPGAVHAHVDHDLSAPPGPRTGRHPLPEPGAFAAACGRWGIGDGVQVVAYDDSGGAWAARAWWLLRHFGHRAVALLDGGLGAWRAAGLPLTRAEAPARPAAFRGFPGHMPTVAAEDVLRGSVACLLDARTVPRFRGEEEPVDPVAGRIPGARSVPVAGNLGSDGRFLPPPALRRRYREALRGAAPREAAVYCGSGVTAPHLLLAMELAGLEGAALYPGSWSEWIRDPARPVARGG